MDDALAWAWSQRARLKPTGVVVLMTLAERAGPECMCAARLDDLCDAVHVSDGVMTRTLRRLEDLALIARVRRRADRKAYLKDGYDHGIGLYRMVIVHGADR